MMYFAKHECIDGAYVDVRGIRYAVTAVRRVRCPEGVNVGYLPFESLHEALSAWKLEPMELNTM